MKDLLKIIAQLIPLITGIIKTSKRAKNEKDKQAFIKALRDGDVDKLNAAINKLSNQD